MFWRDDVRTDATQRMARAMIEQGQSELMDTRDALVAREDAAKAMLSGDYKRVHWKVAASLKRDMLDHGELFNWFVRSEAFVRLCECAEEDPLEIRQQLRTLLALPWNGHLLRRALSRYEEHRRARTSR